ncbi:lsm3 [Symbiodinium sp. KB8]|nr:lsm3 [Symbiodinium sp. KB8]
MVPSVGQASDILAQTTWLLCKESCCCIKCLCGFRHPHPATDLVRKGTKLTRLNLDERIFVKCRGDREIRGRLHAFDQHLNMVLSEVEEISYVREEVPGKEEPEIKANRRGIEMIFAGSPSFSV